MLNENAVGGSASPASLSNATLYGPRVVMSRESFEAVPLVSDCKNESAHSVWRKTLVGGRWCVIDAERTAYPIEIRRYVCED